MRQVRVSHERFTYDVIENRKILACFAGITAVRISFFHMFFLFLYKVILRTIQSGAPNLGNNDDNDDDDDDDKARLIPNGTRTLIRGTSILQIP